MDPAPYIETLSLVERRAEYGDVSSYVFRPKNPVPFVAGQYAHIRLLTLPEGTRRVHEFSFASAPHEDDILLGVDARSGSEYQKALLALAPGETIELFKIKGHMTWPAPVSDVVMLAGGVGVTPFRSMLLDARERKLAITSTLVQVARDEYLYAGELKALANEHLTIRRAELAETLARIASEKPDAHYYIAGSPDFVRTVADDLVGRGVTRVESDEFKGLIEE